jgi:hypothetical protein
MRKDSFLRLVMVIVIIAVSINTFSCKKSEKSLSAGNTASTSAKNKGSEKRINAWIEAVDNNDYEKVVSLFDSLTADDIEILTTEKSDPREAFSYDLNETGDGVVIKEYRGSFEMYLTVIVPKFIEDYPVVAINEFVKKGQTSLLTVVLPNTIKAIRAPIYQNTFSDYLHKINMPTSLEKLTGPVFANTNLSGEIILPDSLAEMDNSFMRSSNITSVKFGNKLQVIPTNAFARCTSLSEVYFSESIKEIDLNAFENTALTKVALPNSLEILDDSFHSCTILGSVVFPSTLKSIGSRSFYGCTNLTDVTIPSDLTTLKWKGGETFKGCSNMKLSSRKQLQDLGYKGSF